MIADTKQFIDNGLRYMDFGEPIEDITASLFHPNSANGILTEIVRDLRPVR